MSTVDILHFFKCNSESGSLGNKEEPPKPHLAIKLLEHKRHRLRLF